MQNQKYGLFVGTKMIHDIMNPRAEEICLAGIDQNHRLMRRFSSNPKALTVWQHVRMVQAIARHANASEGVQRWCLHHDDHEAVITDIPGPLKKIISRHTNVVENIERDLDIAICTARGIPFPTADERYHTHTYDKIAETIEWVHVMRQPQAFWNAPIPPWINEKQARQFATDALNWHGEIDRHAADTPGGCPPGMAPADYIDVLEKFITSNVKVNDNRLQSPFVEDGEMNDASGLVRRLFE
jgi:hypothetical protein